MANVEAQAAEVLEFWFVQTPRQHHFQKNDAFDDVIKTRFLGLYEQISSQSLPWFQDVKCALAGVIVLDQFSRNMFRQDPRAFSEDMLAQRLSRHIIEQDWIKDLSQLERNFALMPFMHSEDANVHAWALPYFEAYADQSTLEFELQHKEIIDRFGRYPHRNEVLGRKDTMEEASFNRKHGGF